ncbi:IS3 family transposase [Thermoanaerobacterium sp. RBIITD]
MVNHHKYYDFSDARIAIFEYIKSWYNQKRIHSAIPLKRRMKLLLQ